MGLLNPWWDWCSRMFKNQMQFSGYINILVLLNPRLTIPG